MSQILPAIRSYIFLSAVLGLLYPLVITWATQTVFPYQSGGSLVEQKGRIVGSKLIGQKFESPNYFWGRPSATEYNPQPSGGSNLGPISDALKKVVDERATKLRAAHGAEIAIPQELLFASASGLDPHISPEAALYQAGRVAQARNLDRSKIEDLVKSKTEARDLGIFGEPRVNVVELNLALDVE